MKHSLFVMVASMIGTLPACSEQQAQERAHDAGVAGAAGGGTSSAGHWGVGGTVGSGGTSSGQGGASNAGGPDAGLGVDCDPDTNPCMDRIYNYCRAVSTGTGYCTTQGCTQVVDCTSGYDCDTTTNPSYCRRPPTGVGFPCATASDCVGEANYCDTMVSSSCLVRDCTLAPDNCFAGYKCCDLRNLGLPTLCVEPSLC
jgi:hypothetical protein